VCVCVYTGPLVICPKLLDTAQTIQHGSSAAIAAIPICHELGSVEFILIYLHFILYFYSQYLNNGLLQPTDTDHI
jgi:hypothetical protein